MPFIPRGGIIGSPAGIAPGEFGIALQFRGTGATFGSAAGGMVLPQLRFSGTGAVDVFQGPQLLASEGFGSANLPVEGLALQIDNPGGVNTKVISFFGVSNAADGVTAVTPSVSFGGVTMRFKGTADGQIGIQRAVNWFIHWLDDGPTGQRQLIANWPFGGVGDYQPRCAYLACLIYSDGGVLTKRVGAAVDQPEGTSFNDPITTEHANSVVIGAIAPRRFDNPVTGPAGFVVQIDDDTGGLSEFNDFVARVADRQQAAPGAVPFAASWPNAAKFGYIGLELASFQVTGEDPDPGFGQGGQEGTGDVFNFDDGTGFGDGTQLEDSVEA